MAVGLRAAALISVLVLAGCGNYSAGGTVGLLLVPVPIKVAACVFSQCWRGDGDDGEDDVAPAPAGPADATLTAAVQGPPIGIKWMANAGALDATLAHAGPLF